MEEYDMIATISYKESWFMDLGFEIFLFNDGKVQRPWLSIYIPKDPSNCF